MVPGFDKSDFTTFISLWHQNSFDTQGGKSLALKDTWCEIYLAFWHFSAL